MNTCTIRETCDQKISKHVKIIIAIRSLVGKTKTHEESLMNFESFFASFHPMLIHFPIVLLICSLVCDIVSLRGGDTSLTIRKAAHWMAIAGGVSCIPALFTGWFAGHEYGWEDPYVVLHRTFAITASIIAIFNAYFRMRFLVLNKGSRMIPLVLNILSVSLITWTAEMGGLLVFGQTPFQDKVSFISADTDSHSISFARPPAQVVKDLESHITFSEVEAIMQKHNCLHCHTSLSKIDLQTALSTVPSPNRILVPMDDSGKLLPMEKVPLYRKVVVQNAMPPKHKNHSAGISTAERLTILLWLQNKSRLGN